MLKRQKIENITKVSCHKLIDYWFKIVENCNASKMKKNNNNKNLAFQTQIFSVVDSKFL